MKKYRTEYYKKPIVEVEIVKETPYYVFLPDGRRVSKYSLYEQYFNTIEAAQRAILANLKDTMDERSSKIQIESHQLSLEEDEFNALKEEFGIE